ncbi:MAG: cation transporter [Oscillospiraceae bacterium]|nr:cation transporter [Oscillospiraceae bacterium]
MVKALAKIFIKDSENVTNPQVRSAYGMLCSVVGILLNVLLFAGKFFAGTISKSVSITADAFNNLSDAGSSVITLLGFKLASQKPDPEHPFGHGRIEYLSGLAVSVAILLMGWELATSSVDKIRNPQAVEFSLLSMVILVVSIAVKLYMGMYNNEIGDKISSAAMKATGADCISDCVSTALVLVAAVVGHFTGLMIDGWCGLLISVFILRAGVEAAKDTIAPLLGQKPDEELVMEIYSIVMAHSEVMGVHDLIVHDYGPGRLMITLHAEVSADGDFLRTHDVIDNIEEELKEKLNCEATIHMDPVATNDEEVSTLRRQVAQRMNELLGGEVSIHDFRMVTGPTHTNVIYDIVVPQGYKYSDGEVTRMAKENILAMDQGQYRAVVKIDHSYI